jgi:hypothetical protein
MGISTGRRASLVGRLGAVVVVVVVSGGAVVSCSSDDGATTTTTTTEESKDFQISTPAGEISVSLDGKLPTGWPTGFPVPDGATPAGSGSLGGKDKTVQVGVFSSSGSARESFDFYTSDTSLGTDEVSTIGSGSTFLGTAKLTGDYSGQVAVTPSADGSYIIVVLQTAGTDAPPTTEAPSTTAGTASTTSTPPSTIGSSTTTTTPQDSGGPA